MEEDKSINEAELIASGKAMMRDGLGARFVLEQMKSAIKDEDIRARVMAAILDKPNILANNQSKKQIVHERKIRQAKFAITDFQEAIQQLNRASILGGIITILMLISASLFNSSNLIFGIMTLITTLGLWFSKSKINWGEKNVILTILAGWMFFLVVELLVFGFPEPIIPGFGERETVKIVHITTIINDNTWLAYPVFRLFMLIPLVMIFYRKGELEKVSPQHLEAARKQL